MSLTTHDLQQINDLITNAITGSEARQDAKWEKRLDEKMDKKFDEFFIRLLPIFNRFATKEDVAEVRADLAEVKEDVNFLKDSFVHLEKKLDASTALNSNRIYRCERALGISL